MYEEIKHTKKELQNALKPFDIVSIKGGTDRFNDGRIFGKESDINVGFIQEVSLDSNQTEPRHRVSYSVEWLINDSDYHNAWFHPGDLKAHGNLFIKIAECSCHPSGHSRDDVRLLFNSGFGLL